MQTHNKLIRSKVIAKLERKGIVHTFHTATDEEYQQKLYEKLVEEAKEFVESNSIEELADLVEVVRAVQKLNGWSPEEVEATRLMKLEKEGDFEGPIILDECEEKTQ